VKEDGGIQIGFSPKQGSLEEMSPPPFQNTHNVIPPSGIDDPAALGKRTGPIEGKSAASQHGPTSNPLIEFEANEAGEATRNAPAGEIPAVTMGKVLDGFLESGGPGPEERARVAGRITDPAQLEVYLRQMDPDFNPFSQRVRDGRIRIVEDPEPDTSPDQE
jgi:hypothetical protein